MVKNRTLNIGIVISALIIVVLSYFGVRNYQVLRYRLTCLNALHHKASGEAGVGEDWAWRYQAFEQVSYDTMLLTFWKPLDEFYKDKSFME